MGFKKILTLALSFVFIATLFGCGNTTKTTEEKFDRESVRETFLEKANGVKITKDTVTFKDGSTKESVTLSRNIKDVMVLYGSFTTLWYEAGGKADYIVGGDSSVALYQEYIGRDITKDEGVTVVATSSSGSRWSVETMIEKNPGLIICSTSMKGYDTISGPAEAANIPVIAVEYADFSDYLKWFKVFSALTNNENLYNTIALASLEKVVDVIEDCSKLEATGVLSLFTGGKSISVNTEYTLVGSMIKALNGKNVASDFDNPLNVDRLDINIESIYAKNPKIILVQRHGTDEDVNASLDKEFASNEIWNKIDAVKNDKIILLEASLYHNKPNSKFALAYQKLAKYLYPDVEFDF